MDRILVPLDGSQFAEAALAAALDLARACGAELHLVQVHEYVLPFPRADALLEDPEYGLEEAGGFAPAQPRLPAGGPPAAELGSHIREDELHELARRENAARLDTLAGDCARRAGVRTRTELLDGVVVPTLARYISDARIDCVVMTTHGRGGLSRVWLGSVADALVRNTHVPVLLLRPGPTDAAVPGLEAIRRILVPLDGSSLAARVIGPAAALAHALGARITLIHAVTPNRPAGRGLGGMSPAVLSMNRARVERYLEQHADRLRVSGLHVDVTLSPHASPPLAILEAADARPDTLIALATHGRGGWARVALGSVADKVLRAAAVPVLLFRPPPDAAGDAAPAGALAREEDSDGWR